MCTALCNGRAMPDAMHTSAKALKTFGDFGGFLRESNRQARWTLSGRIVPINKTIEVFS